jgi:predicted transcriptional regulator
LKKLVISIKSPSLVLDQAMDAFGKIQKGKWKGVHYEIAFDNKKDFLKFIKNIDLLLAIQTLKPKSIYELAKLLGKDQSNLNKTILFLEEQGVLTIEVSKKNNRIVKKPIVDFDKIEFDLAA